MIHPTKCWPCILGHHQQPPVWHSWADQTDVRHALEMGMPDPTTGRCGCVCALPDEPQPVWEAPWDPEGPEDAFEHLEEYIRPCPVCSAPAACGYDAEGRPMVHVDTTEDEHDEDDED